MKSLKQILLVLLIAAVSVLLWEAVHVFTPERMNTRGLAACKAAFSANQAALNDARPALTALAGVTDEAQPIDGKLYAYVRGTSAEECMIVVPVMNVGDFYQNTYTFGLVWATDADPSRLAEKNPHIILVSLEDGWFAYAITRPQ